MGSPIWEVDAQSAEGPASNMGNSSIKTDSKWDHTDKLTTI